MKTTYKTTIAGILGVFTLISPMSTFAVANVAKDHADFCSNIDNVGQKLLTQLDSKLGNLKDKKADRMKNMGDRRALGDARRMEGRGERNKNQDERYEALLGKADTEAKKIAVANFQQATKAAIAKRTNAIDAAVSAFRTGVDALINTKGGVLDTSVATLKNSINTSIATAKSSCASGVSASLVRENFRTSIKNAHDLLKSNKEDVNMKAQMQVLIEARKKAVESAVSIFKVEMEKAQADFKVVFGN